jgi:pimeloyl-ACP methyl ester carboxylesterase
MNAHLKEIPVSTYSVHSGRTKIAAYSRGNPDHTPIILVHGYPDNSDVWNAVAKRLAQHYFVVTYDVRGAGASDSPRKVSAYSLEKLSEDLVAVMDHIVPGRAVHVAGHDWGSIQTWESVTASHLQHRILSYTTLSGPCLDHAGFWMRDRLLSLSPEKTGKALKQLASSWYIMAFQLPVLAPTVWKLAGNYWPEVLKRTEGIHAELAPTQKKDGIFGVNLYRANFIKAMLSPRERYTDNPVQLIVAGRDNYVGTQLFEDITRWAPNTWRRDADAGHWTLLNEGENLAKWIGDFIKQVETGKAASGLKKIS